MTVRHKHVILVVSAREAHPLLVSLPHKHLLVTGDHTKGLIQHLPCWGPPPQAPLLPAAAAAAVHLMLVLGCQ